MTHAQSDYTNRLRQVALDIRSQCAVGDIVTLTVDRGRPASLTPGGHRPLLAMITHIPEDESINACKIVRLEDLGAHPITVLFNDIRRITEEEL